jgi:hypothetical protein
MRVLRSLVEADERHRGMGAHGRALLNTAGGEPRAE